MEGDKEENIENINSFFQNSSFNNITGCPPSHSSSNLTSNSLDITVSENENSKKRSRGGGITCCVPQCYNNWKRNKNLSFYVIPKDVSLRKRWLANISRKDFKPTITHRVCSAHFEGGKKTYLNNVPTIVPKLLLKTPKKERNTRTSLGLLPEILSPIHGGQPEESITDETLLFEKKRTQHWR